MNPRMSQRQAGRLVGPILSWLDAPAFTPSEQWTRAAWEYAKRAVFMHGVAPFLHHRLRQGSLRADGFPLPFRTFLAEQYASNASRVGRMQAELGAILRKSEAASISVMPLKGSLLCALFYDDPALRPMADLDLLVRAESEKDLIRILLELGYQELPPDNPAARERHRRFLQPDNRRVVSREGEHPENPRPVEVHTRLARRLWGNTLGPDLTDQLWRHAEEHTISGHTAWAPSSEDLLSYLALHTLDHLMARTGRAIHWVDLQVVAGRAQLPQGINPNWIYPPLVLASRCLPTGWPLANLSGLAQGVDPRLRRWSQTIPLDGRCGLAVDPSPRALSPWWIHWKRWGPSRWRLAVAYGPAPFPVSLARHVSVVARHFIRRLLTWLKVRSPART